MSKLSRFYQGMATYGGTFIVFIAFEFSFYETLLRHLEERYGEHGVVTSTMMGVPYLREYLIRLKERQKKVNYGIIESDEFFDSLHRHNT